MTFPSLTLTDLQPLPILSEAVNRPSISCSISLQNDAPWREFLWKMKKPTGIFEENHIRAVNLLWDDLKCRVPFSLPLPLTQPTSTGNIQLAWDAGRFYLEIEVRRDGKLEWFFRDRKTNYLAGTEEEPESAVSLALLNRLRQVVIF